MTAPTAADLAAVPLFASLSSEELQATARRFTVRCYPKDAVVATAGDRVDFRHDARLTADRVKTSLGTPVIVENRAGANGFIAAEAVKSAAADGNTLMIAPIAVTVFAPLTHANLRYDPAKDFAPVSLAANFQFALAVGAGSPARTLPEHVAWLRQNPAKTAYGMPLSGGPGHFLGVMVARATAVDPAFVPYKGIGP